MPQMAPMMWQFIFMACLILLTIGISKNFFGIISMKKEMNNISVTKKEMLWKW